jgi:hypothetical protein
LVNNSNNNSVISTTSSLPTLVYVQKHVTSLSLDSFNNVPWGAGIAASGVLIDIDSSPSGKAIDSGIPGENIAFAGNGVGTITNVITSTNGAYLSSGFAPQGPAVSGLTILAHFYGDSRYLSSDNVDQSYNTLLHPTSQSAITLNSSVVKWGKIFSIRGTNLIDTLTGQNVAGELIAFNGTAVIGTPSGSTSNNGTFTTRVYVTASTNVGIGQTVYSYFAGDAKYQSSKSIIPATIQITKHITILSLGTIANVPWNTTTTFPATLTDLDNGGIGVLGKTVHYNGTGVIGVLNQVTNSSGIAIGKGIAPLTFAGGWKVQAQFAEDALYSSVNSQIRTYTSLKHGTTLTLNIVPSTVVHSTTYKITGLLKDSITGAVLGSRTISFTATSPIAISNTVTNSLGTYTISGLIAPSTGVYSITAQYSGETLYAARNSPVKTLTAT